MRYRSTYHKSRGGRSPLLIAGLLAILVTLFGASRARAQGTIVMDGQFGDWAGQACIDDPAEFPLTPELDLKRFCFGNNPDENSAYFMAERWGGTDPIQFRVVIDTNGDQVPDRIVEVEYKPRNGDSEVTLTIYDGLYNPLHQTQDLNWGESKEQGGARVEWAVPFAQLNIQPFQVIDMRLHTAPGQGNAPPVDHSASVRWSPANALGLPLLAGVVVIGVVWLARQRGMLEST